MLDKIYRYMYYLKSNFVWILWLNDNELIIHFIIKKRKKLIFNNLFIIFKFFTLSVHFCLITFHFILYVFVVFFFKGCQTTLSYDCIFVKVAYCFSQQNNFVTCLRKYTLNSCAVNTIIVYIKCMNAVCFINQTEYLKKVPSTGIQVNCEHMFTMIGSWS